MKTYSENKKLFFFSALLSISFAALVLSMNYEKEEHTVHTVEEERPTETATTSTCKGDQNLINGECVDIDYDAIRNEAYESELKRARKIFNSTSRSEKLVYCQDSFSAKQVNLIGYMTTTTIAIQSGRYEAKMQTLDNECFELFSDEAISS